MTPLVIDCEATIFQKGNPFSRQNKLMCVGVYTPYQDFGYEYYPVEHDGLPYDAVLEVLKKTANSPYLIVGFNIKYDLHWLRRYIPGLQVTRVWDCQLAEFILSDQTTPYPSLDECLAKYGLPPKDDRIKRDYWDKGIDTNEVPAELLQAYNRRDCEATYELYLKQVPLLTGNKLRLFQLHCADLLVLQEMEFRGLLFNAKQSLIEGSKTDIDLQAAISKLNLLVGRNDINWNSPQQLSSVLYGGDIAFKVRERTERLLKDGTTKVGERWGISCVSFPRLVDPLDGTENDNGYSTDEPTLRSVQAKGQARQIIELALEISKLDKLKGTYYNGLPELITKMDWELDTLHGQLNQCMARTGRLSSSQPNLQNMDPRLKPLIYSAFN